LLILNTLHSYPEGWSDDVLLTPETPGYRLDPDVSVDSYNNVWVVWDSNFWGSGYVYYSKRDSLGNCIIPETMLPDPAHTSGGHPKVVVDNSYNVHIQWTEPSPTGKGIGYAKLDNSGAIIVNPHLAMPGHGGGSSCNRHEIAIDKHKNINVVWDESPLETNQISYTKLDSLGDTIISKVRVSPVGLYSIWPGIGVDSFGNVHMAYRTDTAGTSDRLTYSKLDSNGNVLIPHRILGFGGIPVIIADRSQNMHMIYADPTGPGISIKYLKLDQQGNFLVSPQTISIHQDNSYPHMAIDSLQYLHAVWDTEIGTIFPIMYAKLDTLGNFIIPPMQVVYPPHTVRGGGAPRISVDSSNRLHLVWVDDRLYPFVSTDIYYKRGENETGVMETGGMDTEEELRFSISPNPFSKKTRISFAFAQNARSLKFEIFDITGRVVKEFNPAESEGSICWDGTNNAGDRLSAGVYFIHVSSQEGKSALPIILLK
jgi:hypothetical protein